ncbi:hypothetical protein GCM10009634_38470 [Saccharothrix xinjiangensis]
MGRDARDETQQADQQEHRSDQERERLDGATAGTRAFGCARHGGSSGFGSLGLAYPEVAGRNQDHLSSGSVTCGIRLPAAAIPARFGE